MDIISLVGGTSLIGLAMLFVETKGVKDKIQKWPVFAKCWHHLKAFSFAVSGTCIAGAVTSGLLVDYAFPNQSKSVFSGSPVTVASFLFWGALGLWVATGSARSDSDATGNLSTLDGRFTWLIEQPIKAFFALATILAKPAMWLLCALAAVIVFGVIYLVANIIDEKLSSMAPANAIVLAGVIIAAAILAVGSRR